MAMKLPTLYKVKKKILQWDIETRHSPEYSEYIITHGQKDGKLQTTSTMVTQGKNLGKANETSIEQQCDLEAKALWQRQIDRKGYSTIRIKNMDTDVYDEGVVKLPSPMLALEYDKFAHKVVFPCYIQPKLDGVRCLAYLRDDKVVLVSRQRKEFNHLDHLRSELYTYLKAYPKLILDGELYSHKYTFQEIISAIKRDEPNDLTKDVEYHVYDMISNDDFSTRETLLKNYFVDGFVKSVETQVIQSADEIEKWHEVYTKQGYEGLMVRNASGKYKQDGRSQDLLKYKKFMEQEFPIVGANQNKGKLSNTCTFQLEHNGVTFSAMPDGSEEERAKLYQDWKDGNIKVGDLATVTFFSWSTSESPIPRFPIFKSVRSYE